jgi:hypothetical protein
MKTGGSALLRDIQLREAATGEYRDVLFADGFEEAFLGLGSRFTYQVAVYDRRKCIKILIARDEMSPEDAEEYFGFNVEGAYMGEHTPIFLEPEDARPAN